MYGLVPVHPQVCWIFSYTCIFLFMYSSVHHQIDLTFYLAHSYLDFRIIQLSWIKLHSFHEWNPTLLVKLTKTTIPPYVLKEWMGRTYSYFLDPVCRDVPLHACLFWRPPETILLWLLFFLLVWSKRVAGIQVFFSAYLDHNHLSFCFNGARRTSLFVPTCSEGLKRRSFYKSSFSCVFVLSWFPRS